MRVIVDLDNDIGQVIPHLSEVLDSYGYNPETLSVGFRWEGLPVIIERQRVTVYNTEDKAMAQRVIEWLNSIIDL